MKVTLIAGYADQIIRSYEMKSVNIINEHAIFFVDMNTDLITLKTDKILIIDNGSYLPDTKKIKLIKQLVDDLESKSLHTDILLITKSLTLYNSINGLYKSNITCRYTLNTIGKNLLTNNFVIDKKSNSISQKKLVTSEPFREKAPTIEKSKSFFEQFKRKPKLKTFDKTTDLENSLRTLGRGVSKTIAITGHRGSGITTTAINLATQASKQGLSSMIIDMDIGYRSMNLYFNGFNEQTKKSEEINASLIRLLARPNQYMINTHCENNNLWVSSLGYDFYDKRLIEKFYTVNHFIAMISLLKTKFNIVILDFPLEVLTDFEDACMHIDLFGLCVENSLYSVLTTIRNIEVNLSDDTAKYLNSKSKLIVNKFDKLNKFDGEFFTPEKVSELFASGITDKFPMEMRIGGVISKNDEYNNQIESEMPLVKMNQSVETEYNSMLLRMIEGV